MPRHCTTFLLALVACCCLARVAAGAGLINFLQQELNNLHNTKLHANQTLNQEQPPRSLYGLQKEDISQDIQAALENLCVPESFNISQKAASFCTGPKLTLEVLPAVCSKPSLGHDLVCSPAKVVVRKQPAQCTVAGHTPSTLIGKECKLEKEFGEAKTFTWSKQKPSPPSPSPAPPAFPPPPVVLFTPQVVYSLTIVNSSPDQFEDDRGIFIQTTASAASSTTGFPIGRIRVDIVNVTSGSAVVEAWVSFLEQSQVAIDAANLFAGELADAESRALIYPEAIWGLTTAIVDPVRPVVLPTPPLPVGPFAPPPPFLFSPPPPAYPPGSPER